MTFKTIKTKSYIFNCSTDDRALDFNGFASTRKMGKLNDTGIMESIKLTAFSQHPHPFLSCADVSKLESKPKAGASFFGSTSS